MSQYSPGPQRHQGKFIGGIVLVAFGIFVFLGQLAAVSQGLSPKAENAGELIGHLLGIAVLGVLPLVVGIVLIRKSKPRK